MSDLKEKQSTETSIGVIDIGAYWELITKNKWKIFSFAFFGDFAIRFAGDVS